MHRKNTDHATKELFSICYSIKEKIPNQSLDGIDSSESTPFSAERVAVIQKCIENGADILYCDSSHEVRSRDWRIPVLHRFIEYGFVEAVRACLSTTHPIDFTIAADYGDEGNFASPYQHFKTPLQLLCELDSDEAAVAILEAIIERLERTSFGRDTPMDIIEWGNETGDDDELFLNNAGAHHRLSLFWPVVKNRVPYFRDKVNNGPIPLTDDVFSFDWDQLSTEDHECFDVENGVLGPSESLNRLSMETRPNLRDVEKCLRDPDINVSFIDDDQKIYSTSLHWFVFSGAVECFEACLTVPGLHRRQSENAASFLYVDRIDFTVLNRQQQTILHMICEVACPATAKRLIEAVVEHLQTHPADMVDWSQKNRQGLSFIDCACVHQKLSLFWPIVKELPYFSDRAYIVLDHHYVLESDWKNLSADDQSCFVFAEDEYE